MEMKIKRAALKLFGRKGYERTTIRDIANEVGLKGSSIYSHFTNKEEIFLKVVNDLFETMVWESKEFMDNKLVNEDLKSLLLKIFKGYYLFFAENEDELLFWQRIRFFPPVGFEGKYDINRLLYEKPIVEVYFELFKYGIETKQLRNADIEILVMSFFVFISGFTDSLILVPFKLSEEQLEKSFEIFWEGTKY